MSAACVLLQLTTPSLNNPRARQVHTASARIREMKISMKMRLSYYTFRIFLLALLAAASAAAQTAQVFRLDGGNSTYVLGVNERGELQPLYWGGRLGPHDAIAPAHSFPEVASFDSPYTTTPQEYA